MLTPQSFPSPQEPLRLGATLSFSLQEPTESGKTESEAFLAMVVQFIFLPVILSFAFHFPDKVKGTRINCKPD